MVPLGSHVVDFGSIIKLTETGAFLWSLLNSDQTIDELAKSLTDEYDVSFDKAKADTEKFVNKLKDADLLE